MNENTIADTATRSDSVNQSALRAVRVRIVDVKKRTGEDSEPAEPGKTATLAEDPWKTLASEGQIILPPFDMIALAMLPEHSSELNQCIEAMETNIDAFGHRHISRVRTNDPLVQIPEATKAEINKERVKLTNFFEYATAESFVEFRMKLRRDRETTGNAYFEVVRNAKGEIQSFQHIPSYQMRLTRSDSELTEIKRPILELQEDGEVKVSHIVEWRRFRRFVQVQSHSRRNFSSVAAQKRYFKSFLDPRRVNRDTGAVESDGAPVPDESLANEVVHLVQYSARSPYGLPRYIGNLLSIYGDRAAEEINYTTFRNNNIPSMVVLVSNGVITDGSIQRIESFVESQIQGSDNYSKFLIIEGEPNAEDGEEHGQVKVDVKPLTKDQHDDALFQNYSDKNQEKIRRAFRLPPIFVGKTADYTRSTAEASRRLADEQVFAPLREAFDAFVNRDLYPAMGIRYHKYKSNSPNTTDNEQLVRILAGAEKTGGMTPRIARTILSDILGLELPDFPADFDADRPFSLAMAEAVKNKADAGEPGQQVTALKALLGDVAPDVELSDPLLAFLVATNKSLEEQWRGAPYAGEDES